MTTGALVQRATIFVIMKDVSVGEGGGFPSKFISLVHSSETIEALIKTSLQKKIPGKHVSTHVN